MTKILVIVLILVLVAFAYNKYNSYQLGINYKPQTWEQYAIMKEAQGLINSLKPYYCHYLKGAMEASRLALEEVTPEQWDMDCSAYLENLPASEGIPEDVSVRYDALLEKIVKASCVDGKPDKQKMLANLDMTYDMLCKGITTKEWPEMPSI